MSIGRMGVRTGRGSRFTALVAASAVLAGGLALAAPQAAAAPGEPSTPIANPDLQVACGLDILVILDESGSVKPFKSDVQRAFRAFTSSLKNTGSRLAVNEFSTVARLPLNPPAPAKAQDYITVTDATIASVFEPYISGQYVPDGATNWEDGFRVGRFLQPRPSAAQPHLVVFITDGNPNKIIRENRVTQLEYETQVPLRSDQVQDANDDTSANRAVSNSNGLKATGSHVLALAVGDGLSSSSALNRLKKVSGPDVFPDNGRPFDISTTDVYREPNFALLEQALREAAFQLCAPSVTVRKLVDLTPDTGVEDAVPGAGFGITAVAAPTPKLWVLPAGATGDTATTQTDASGFAAFQWDTTNPVASSVTITEQDPGGVVPGLVYDPALTTCTYRTPDLPDRPLAVTPVPLGFTAVVPPDAIVTCTIYNRLPATPAIEIEKSTNGTDADQAPGPSVPVGRIVEWDYTLVNTGDVSLSNIVVTDDQGVRPLCPGGTALVLAPGEAVVCSAGAQASLGQYKNIGTVTATSPDGVTVTDSDPSHYVGVEPGIDIEKATNGFDADDAPGPVLRPGDAVRWTYVVRNTGQTPLTSVAVNDDVIGPITCPADTLAVGAEFTCTADGFADRGQYENTATATGLSGRQPVADSDASHYFGVDARVDVEKSTNGFDADTPTGPLVPVGGLVNWRYLVTNPGNVPLSGWQPTDSDGSVTVACPRLLFLFPGESLFCTASGAAAAGQYANTATVSATAVAPGLALPPVTDADDSHYFGVVAAIDIQKATNGEDADTAPGPFIPVGSKVTWSYVVTNTGNGPLTDVGVVDDQEGAVTCPKSALAPSEAMTCTPKEGTAAVGDYTNEAFATGVDSLGRPVTDADPSHHFGAEPGITLEKSTNGDDADLPEDAPLIPVGDPVEWVYQVTNSGNTTLTSVAVVDDQGVATTCPKSTLAAFETMACTGSGFATRGLYTNIATATGLDRGATVSDTDPSHYFGFISTITLTKFTNDEDANSPTGPYVPVGGPVRWNYVLTNTGDIPLERWTITDSDPSVTIACPTIDQIAPGASLTCVATGTATPGQYANTADVVALDELEQTLTASDPSHYFGAAPAIDIEKATNGEDADTAPGPKVLPGSTVTWTYVVKNTGNVPLTGLTVSDDKLGAITCPATELAVGATVACQASGQAIRGQYANVGTATAMFQPPVTAPTAPTPAAALADTAPVTVTDTDPSNYLGEDAAALPADIANTGAQIGGAAAAGLLFVLVGLGLAGAARRRRSLAS